MTVGSRLRRYRQARGWDQAELGRRARSSQQTVSEIETDKRDPRESTLVKLADALGVSVGAFFADDGTPPPVPPRPPKTPDVDEKPELFDQRFGATTLAAVEQLRDGLDAQLEDLQTYAKALKAAGIPETDHRLRRARAKLDIAQHRLYATTSRELDLARIAEAGEGPEPADTVAGYAPRIAAAEAAWAEMLGKPSQARPEAV